MPRPRQRAVRVGLGGSADGRTWLSLYYMNLQDCIKKKNLFLARAVPIRGYTWGCGGATDGAEKDLRMMRDGMPLALAGLPWMVDGPAGAVIGSRSHVKNQTSKRRRLFKHPKNLSSARELRSLYFPLSFSFGWHIPIHIHADKLDDVQRSLFSFFLLSRSNAIKMGYGISVPRKRKKKRGCSLPCCHRSVVVMRLLISFLTTGSEGAWRGNEAWLPLPLHRKRRNGCQELVDRPQIRQDY